MLYTLPLLPFAAAILLLLLKKYPSHHIGWYILPIPIGLFLAYLSYLPTVSSGAEITQSLPWIQNLGIHFSFRLSGLSILFSLLISFVGVLVVLYSIYYMSKKERLASFYTFLLIFMGAMFGVVTADNLLVLYLFWELTSVSSFLLIGYWFERDASTYGAQKAMLITVSGGFCLLAAFVLLGVLCGTFEISQITAMAETVKDSPLYTIIALLIMIGAFAKSAQVPLHIWLPTAMEAPTPISCYLHSATMVKAGIFLLARFTPILGSTWLWNSVIPLVGLTSLVFGSVMALKQTDLKAILAYSTISQLGLIVCLVGMGTDDAVFAAMFHLVSHSAFKGSLFLMVGIVDHETGTRDIRLLHGLRKAMPCTAAIALIGSLAMAGLPPFSGFLSKEMFFQAAFEAPLSALSHLGPLAWAVPVLAVVASTLTFVYSLSIYGKVFLGSEVTSETPKRPHEAPLGMLLPGFLLVSLNLTLALGANFFAELLIAPAVGAVTGHTPHLHVSFWHGITPALLMTLAVVAAGSLLYLRLSELKQFLAKFRSRFGPAQLYDWALPALITGSSKVTGSYMTGSLSRYLAFILCAAMMLIAIPIAIGGFWTSLVAEDYAYIELIEVIMMIITAAAAIRTATMKRRVQAILSLGIVGFMVSMFFIMYSAPDLAQTQLLVETVTLILYVVVLRQFPSGLSPEVPTSSGKKRLRLAISIAFGAGIAFLSLFTHANRQFDPVSWFFTENSKALSGGGNVVHVIMVDFLGLNTMGEMVVLVLASLGVFTLLNLHTDKRGRLRNTPPPFAPASTWDQPTRLLPRDNDIILLTMVKPIAFIIFYVSVYLFFAGHNSPGGGLIAGIMTACGLLLLHITLGREFIDTLPVRVDTFLPIGLAVAIFCGSLGALQGGAFLQQSFLHLEASFFGELEISTAMIFDFGSYLVVVGTLMTIIYSIVKAQVTESEREE